MKQILLTLFRQLMGNKFYFSVRYFLRFKRLLSWDNPQTFNAKINWIKLFYKKPILHTLVDKHKVRDYIKEKIGSDILIEEYGYYTDVEKINFSSLPEQFVFLGTHGSGQVLICKNKKTFDIKSAKKIMRKWLKTDYYKKNGEWVYKDVVPGIICERYMESSNESALLDYKIYCFNGEPKLCHVDLGRFIHHERVFYDLEWNKLPFTLCFPSTNRNVACPKQWEKMIEIAKILSKDFPFVRVDLYEINNKIYFGEMTFTPGDGLEPFIPDSYDFELGKYLRLPNDTAI